MSTDNPPIPATAGRSRWPRRLVILGAVLGVGALIWSQLPSGTYSGDLSRIGSGRPVVVLTQDVNYVGGMEVMELMHVVRDRHGADVDFLVADLGVPDAQRFAAQQRVADGTVLLFAADGRRVGMLNHPETVDELQAAIVKAFGLQR